MKDKQPSRRETETAELWLPAKYQDSDSSDYENDDENPGALKEKAKKERPNPGSQETFIIKGDR